MVARQESHPPTGAVGPAEFRAAAEKMRAAAVRPEVFCEEMPAPQRIAPWSTALSADVTVDEVDLGTGRIILLHDPAGNDAWDGTFRCGAGISSQKTSGRSEARRIDSTAARNSAGPAPAPLPGWVS